VNQLQVRLLNVINLRAVKCPTSPQKWLIGIVTRRALKLRAFHTDARPIHAPAARRTRSRWGARGDAHPDPDPGAFGQQLRRDAIKEQLDREPIARREAGSFASPALTISAGADELDARSERERLP
jgi:hypothetical protein